jgi:hypothetical protein
MGYLRRIHVPENQYQSVGALVAELSTTENESLDDGAAHAAAFRVVPNLVS